MNQDNSLLDRIEDALAEVVADNIVYLLEWFEHLWKSSATIIVIGVATHQLWDPVLGGLVPRIGLPRAISIAFLARVLCGSPAVSCEPPLDAEERALLIRELSEESGGPQLRILKE